MKKKSVKCLRIVCLYDKAKCCLCSGRMERNEYCYSDNQGKYYCQRCISID